MADYKSGVTILPGHMHQGMIEYIEEGRPVGGFLFSILCNDFVRAASRADMTNIMMLREYALYLHSHAPQHCWGSEAKVKAWQAHGGLNGVRASDF